MRSARWYATATTLPNGETFIQGGRAGPGRQGWREPPRDPRRGGQFPHAGGIDTSSLYWWYPRNWVAPDGRIFGFTDRTMYYVNPNGKGSIQFLGDTNRSPRYTDAA